MDIKINSSVIRIEVVKNFFSRALGLMFRKNLPEDCGMLFVFESERRHAFWNLGVGFEIDIVWLSSDGKVVDIAKNVPPNSMEVRKPKRSAKYAIELAGGLSSKLGLGEGNTINLDNLQKK